MSRVGLSIYAAGRSVWVRGCEACPAYHDPEPRPDYCAFDLAETRTVVPLPEQVPSNCPLRHFNVEVIPIAEGS